MVAGAGNRAASTAGAPPPTCWASGSPWSRVSGREDADDDGARAGVAPAAFFGRCARCSRIRRSRSVCGSSIFDSSGTTHCANGRFPWHAATHARAASIVPNVTTATVSGPADFIPGRGGRSGCEFTCCRSTSPNPPKNSASVDAARPTDAGTLRTYTTRDSAVRFSPRCFDTLTCSVPSWPSMVVPSSAARAASASAARWKRTKPKPRLAPVDTRSITLAERTAPKRAKVRSSASSSTVRASPATKRLLPATGAGGDACGGGAFESGASGRRWAPSRRGWASSESADELPRASEACVREPEL
mmetsp:Transcript_21570/g.66926  ORF Transcript_21570/g.66926 Transcript_21570/m.66926 type:complete len:303 (-) Transcript_21570:397-1305(-)